MIGVCEAPGDGEIVAARELVSVRAAARPTDVPEGVVPVPGDEDDFGDIVNSTRVGDGVTTTGTVSSGGTGVVVGSCSSGLGVVPTDGNGSSGINVISAPG